MKFRESGSIGNLICIESLSHESPGVAYVSVTELGVFPVCRRFRMWPDALPRPGARNPGSCHLPLPSLSWQAGTVALWHRDGPVSVPYLPEFWACRVAGLRYGHGC